PLSVVGPGQSRTIGLSLSPQTPTLVTHPVHLTGGVSRHSEQHHFPAPTSGPWVVGRVGGSVGCWVDRWANCRNRWLSWLSAPADVPKIVRASAVMTDLTTVVLRIKAPLSLEARAVKQPNHTW